MNRVMGCALALAVTLATFCAGVVIPQWGDGYGDLVWRSTDAMARGFSSVPAAVGDDGVTVVDDQPICGLYGVRQFQRHYPQGPTYVIALGALLGAKPQHVPVAFTALSLGLLVFLLARRSLTGTVPVAAFLAVAPWAAPGYGTLLTYPFFWKVASLALLASAALGRRAWVMLPTAFVAFWVGQLMLVQPAVALGFLVAAGGPIVRPALFGFVGALVGWIAHQAQLWCYFGFDYSRVAADYVTGGSGGTSVLFRLRPEMGVGERLQSVALWIPSYVAEAAMNSRGEWTEAWFWLVAFGAAVLCRPTRQAVVGAAVVLAGLPVFQFILPNMLPHHLHSMPRVVPMILLLAVACLAVRRDGGSE